MEFIIGNRFKLLNKIGIGGFGEVYKALDTKSNQVVALKLENRTQGAPLLHYEKKLLGRLKGLPCLPNIVQNGVEGDFNYLAMEFIGYSLEHYHTFCGKKFSNQTLAMIAIQALQVVWDVHNRSIIHRDLKPENFLISEKSGKGTLYLIDFGLSKLYKNDSGQHIPRAENKGFKGTLRYASVNMHRGVENSRRDDLESLGYVLIYLAKGKLPWQGLKVPQHERADAIGKMKMKMQLKTLCNQLPPQFLSYMRLVKNLGFSETPDYAAYIDLFAELLEEDQRIFDWEMMPNYQEELKNIDIHKGQIKNEDKADSIKIWGAESSIGFDQQQPSRGMTILDSMGHKQVKQDDAVFESYKQKKSKQGTKTKGFSFKNRGGSKRGGRGPKPGGQPGGGMGRAGPIIRQHKR